MIAAVVLMAVVLASVIGTFILVMAILDHIDAYRKWERQKLEQEAWRRLMRRNSR